MTDLLHTLPAFPTAPYTHLLPSLERRRVSTTDLLTLDAADVAKRAQLPVADVRRLAGDVLEALRKQLGVPDSRDGDGSLRKSGPELADKWAAISTLDPVLDVALGGGIPTGYVTEITGESGAGKTQVLLTLLLSAQLPPPHGLSRNALYISTEAPLPTSRLTGLLASHPILSSNPQKPSLSNILSISTADLESQDHILHYQVPVAISRHGVGLVVMDSVAANYRAEFAQNAGGRSATLARRSASLQRLGAHLRSLARTQNVAVVVANQVSDRFETTDTPSSSLAPTPLHPVEALTLDHQQRWFSGWGLPSSSNANLKTPALGHTWTLQLDARIALLKTAVYAAPRDGDDGGEQGGWTREMSLVFSPWSSPSVTRFEITRAGVRGTVDPPRASA